VASLLALTVSVLVLIGVLATPLLIDLIAPGFSGAKRELTISLVRILFPGAGLLVGSAWCLGVLNSHHKFFLSYTAPIAWNAVMIATLLAWGGRREQFPLALVLAWGSVAGSALQALVQLPAVLKLLQGWRWSASYRTPSVRTVLYNFLPVFVGRGVVQISAYVDALIASLLPTGAVAGLSYAQTLYTLPVSLFGMSVSAAELPAMSAELGVSADASATLRPRLDAGLRQIAYFVVPSAVAFMALGDVIVAAIYRTGRFQREDVLYVWAILAAASIGLLTSTLGRLYASTYYALRDTRTPLRYAVLRVALTGALGYVFAVHLPHWVGIPQRWGVVGLATSTSLAGWLEYALLRRSLNLRIGRTGLPPDFLFKLWAAAGAAAAVAGFLHHQLGSRHPAAEALLILAPYGAIYFLATWLAKVPEAQTFLQLAGRSRFWP